MTCLLPAHLYNLYRLCSTQQIPPRQGPWRDAQVSRAWHSLQ